ncbi:aminoglycoside phosphotransferase family protein [Streptomyces aurantiacus]|nr:aminoglycoside phosphotransferase family protein [Streptomyces aurantiacus]
MDSSPAPEPPTPSVIHGLVRQVLPHEPGLAVEPVDEGGEHSTWWVGDRYVLRLTLDPDAGARQRRELLLRDAIRPRLPVGVPASVAAGVWAPGLTYTVDTRLSGTSADHRPVCPEGESDLAGLLAGLRGLPPAAMAALRLPEQRPRALDRLHAAAEEAADLLTAVGEMPAALASHRASGTRDHSAPAPNPVVLHNDLKGEHLMVSSAGRVSGVLDWADAALGDPAEDVAGLALSVGASAAVRVATAAGHAPEVARRGVLLARYDTAIRLAERLRGRDDSPLPLLRAQLARAWER